MWLLNCDTAKLESFEGEDRPPYAILSHRWEGKEVNYQDVMAGNHIEQKGWQKIKACCEQAKRDGLDYVWADTCCIDKKSSAELSEAINSMYQWYRQAKVCYAYLVDVDSSVLLREMCEDEDDVLSRLVRQVAREKSSNSKFAKYAATQRFSDISVRWQSVSSDDGRPVTPGILAQFLKSVWFTRGWTLQELLASE